MLFYLKLKVCAESQVDVVDFKEKRKLLFFVDLRLVSSRSVEWSILCFFH